MCIRDSYMVTAGLDGGDTAFLINGTSGYPFGFSLKLTSNQVCAEVGSSAFGDNTVCNTDTGWGMANKHIWRFVMNAAAVHFWLFRDGILVADHNSTNNQTRDSSVLSILDAAGGLG